MILPIIAISLTDVVFIINEALLSGGDIERLNHVLWGISKQRDRVFKAFTNPDAFEYGQLFESHDFEQWPKLYKRKNSPCGVIRWE